MQVIEGSCLLGTAGCVGWILVVVRAIAYTSKRVEGLFGEMQQGIIH